VVRRPSSSGSVSPSRSSSSIGSSIGGSVAGPDPCCAASVRPGNRRTFGAERGAA
jgi:hypothetical protein